MTHVFIVDDNTLKIHLEYMFAGTTGDKPYFLNDPKCSNPKEKKDGALTFGAENKNVSMIADICRVKNGDKILFYKEKGYGDGMFFGVFKAVEEPFYDDGDETYLKNQLNTDLHYRVRIEPLEVYKYGISEYDVIDSLQGINHPYEMCWSLMYRKLKAGRGCTMITDFEYDRILGKIKSVPNNQLLTGKSFSFDYSKNEIVNSQCNQAYNGVINLFGDKVLKRLMYKKFVKGNAAEVYLQAYLIQQIVRGSMDNVLSIDALSKDFWIGNEVFCSMGKRQIDLLTLHFDNNCAIFNIIELKSVIAEDYIIKEQLPKYYRWVEEYLAPLQTNNNKNVKIRKSIISLMMPNGTNKTNYLNELKSNSINLIEFDKDNNNIKFYNTLTI